MILLSTKINELEYSLSQKVFINPTLYIDERNPDFKIDKSLDFFDLNSTLTKDDYIYLEWYISDAGQFASFNEKLRNDTPLTYVESIIYKQLFKILRKGVIKKGTILYRGIDIKKGIKGITAEKYESCKPGNIITNKSFISTSLSKGVALDFLAKNTKCCILQITLIEDIKGGIYLPTIGSGKNNEKEILFLPGTVFRYKDTYKDFGSNKIFRFYMTHINPDIYLERYITQQDIDDMNDEEFEQQEIDAENQIEEFKEIPENCSHQTKKNFIVFFNKEDSDKYRQNYLPKIDKFIEKLNDRKSYDRFFEDIFGKMILKYLKMYKGYTYDFDTMLNSILTLEKDLGQDSEKTSIRQLLNKYISKTNEWLEDDYGTLYKTGGEATRYYTKANGDLISNDIDSKFCVKPIAGRQQIVIIRDDKVIKDIFPKITKSIIILAEYIKHLKIKSGIIYGIENTQQINNPPPPSPQFVGEITVYKDKKYKEEEEEVKHPEKYDKESLIYNYISVRSNFVGCKDGILATGNYSKDCMRIISIDITYKIILDNFFEGKNLEFYVTTAPYDFLISNETCDYQYIQERKIGNDVIKTKPRIVSLKFIIKDLLNLFSPAGTGVGGGGDLEKRIKTGKHKKDKFRFIALLKTLATDAPYNRIALVATGVDPTRVPILDHNILNNDFDQKENTERIRILKYLKDIHIDINIEAGNDDLDKECPHPPIRNRGCDYLENILPKVFNETLSAADLTNIVPFQQQKKLEEINIKSIKLNRILDFNPKKSFRVFFN